MTELLAVARRYRAAGLSVIRVRADGSKAPWVGNGWERYSSQPPTDAELARWFDGSRECGIGVPGGPASGNLAVLDFETWPAYEAWLRALPAASQALTRGCPLARTGGGGAHLYVRLPDPVPSTVLARREHPAERNPDGSPRPKTLIEVKGDRGQVVAPGSPPATHQTGNPYEWLREGWVSGGPSAELDFAEWFTWTSTAAELNEYVPPVTERPKVPPREERVLDHEPGRDFNRRAAWEETGLFAAGWAWEREIEHDRGYVRRPGKGRGNSGTLGMVHSKATGCPLFYCFTSDGHPFEHNGSYDKFGVYARLSHCGDFTAAASALYELGYGVRTEPRGRSRTIDPRITFRGSPIVPSAPNGRHHNGDTKSDPAPAAAPADLLPVLRFAEIGPCLDAADFVAGLLTVGGMSVIYGESNTGKSFFVLDLALHVAMGEAWRDRPVDRGGVLYLALEGAHGVRNRVAAFKKANASNAAELPFAVVPVSVNLLNPAADTERVIATARAEAERMRLPVSLIVVDTLSRAIAGGNENSSEDMGALVGCADRIRQALPAHVSFVHHSGKDAAKGARGHSLLRAATDTEIEVTHDPVTRTSVARVTKQRDLDRAGEFAFRLERVELGHNRRGEAVTSCVVREENVPEPTRTEGGLTGDQQRALDALHTVIGECGQKGHVGVPDDVRSVPEKFWRDRFYAAKKKATEDAKRQAFNRAKTTLVQRGLVGETNNRVWVAGPGQTVTNRDMSHPSENVTNRDIPL